MTVAVTRTKAEQAYSESFEAVAAKLPVEGSLQHLRLYLPAANQTIAVDWIELWQTGEGPRRLERWDFGGAANADGTP